MFFHIARIILFLPLLFFYPVRLRGKRNIPKGKCIMVCNHTSGMDGVVLLQRIGRKQFVLAKKELFQRRAKGWFLKKCGAIPVDRKNLDLAAIRTSLSVLKSEKLLTIFPEGTRNKGDLNTMLEVKNGAAMLAIKAGAPIVPVWIQGRVSVFRPNKIYFGKPFRLEQTKVDKESLAAASEIIGNKIFELSDYARKEKKQKAKKQEE